MKIKIELIRNLAKAISDINLLSGYALWPHCEEVTLRRSPTKSFPIRILGYVQVANDYQVGMYVRSTCKRDWIAKVEVTLRPTFREVFSVTIHGIGYTETFEAETESGIIRSILAYIQERKRRFREE